MTSWSLVTVKLLDEQQNSRKSLLLAENFVRHITAMKLQLVLYTLVFLDRINKNDIPCKALILLVGRFLSTFVKGQVGCFLLLSVIAKIIGCWP